MGEREIPDDLIDAVARGMTACEPKALAARLAARLESRRVATFAVRCAGLLAATLACWLVATRDHDRGVPSNGERPSLIRSVPAVSMAVIGVPIRLSAPPVAAAPRHAANRSVPATRPEALADRLAWHAGAVPALDPPPPLEMARLQPDGLEIRPLDTPPLRVPEIAPSRAEQ